MLIRALEGHPKAGAYWENHCTKAIMACGFEKMEGWESVFVHREMQLFLNVYVDDFKLCGKIENIPIMWKMLREHLDLDEPTKYNSYLGCNIKPCHVDKKMATEKCQLYSSIFTTLCAKDVAKIEDTTALRKQARASPDEKMKAISALFDLPSEDENDVQIMTFDDDDLPSMSAAAAGGPKGHISKAKTDPLYNVNPKAKPQKKKAKKKQRVLADPLDVKASTDEILKHVNRDLLQFNDHSVEGVKAYAYEMEGFSEQCVETYLELTGASISTLTKVATPNIDDHQFEPSELIEKGEYHLLHHG